MKNIKSKKNVWNKDLPVWVAIVSAVVLGYLIYALGYTKMDTRSSANDDVEAGVVLPVSSDRN